MQYKIINLGRLWPRVSNHVDCRHCPDCGATVNGNRGQRHHQRWHIQLAELLSELSERAGIEHQETPWTAVVDGDQEAIGSEPR